MIEMRVAGVIVDPPTRIPVVLLRDPQDRRALRIYVSQDQAQAIFNAYKHQVPLRPFTHDLMINILKEWDLTVERVVIHSLQDNTFHAVVTVRQGEVKKDLDARSSDAIALALRANAPIWVFEEVIADASIPVDEEADEAEQQAFREFLANLRPEDLIQRGGWDEERHSS